MPAPRKVKLFLGRGQDIMVFAPTLSKEVESGADFEEHVIKNRNISLSHRKALGSGSQETFPGRSARLHTPCCRTGTGSDQHG